MRSNTSIYTSCLEIQIQLFVIICHSCDLTHSFVILIKLSSPFHICNSFPTLLLIPNHRKFEIILTKNTTVLPLRRSAGLL